MRALDVPLRGLRGADQGSDRGVRAKAPVSGGGRAGRRRGERRAGKRSWETWWRCRWIFSLRLGSRSSSAPSAPWCLPCAHGGSFAGGFSARQGAGWSTVSSGMRLCCSPLKLYRLRRLDQEFTQYRSRRGDHDVDHDPKLAGQLHKAQADLAALQIAAEALLSAVDLPFDLQLRFVPVAKFGSSHARLGARSCSGLSQWSRTSSIGGCWGRTGGTWISCRAAGRRCSRAEVLRRSRHETRTYARISTRRATSGR